MHIVDHEAPGLSQRLTGLSQNQRHRLVARVCDVASRSVPDPEPSVRFLVESISRDNFLPASRVAEARSLAEAADERYFALQEEGAETQVWLRWFWQARLLTGIANEFGGSSWQDTADALYELFHTRDDPSALIALAESEAASAAGTR